MPAAIFQEDATLNPAPLWRRIMAMFYDSILMIAIWFVTTMLYMLIKGIVIGLDAMRQIAESEPATSDPLLTVCLLMSTFLFFAYFWQKLGQTLGMQVWRIRIQNMEGGGINWQQCTLRFLGAILAAAPLGLGYLWILWDADKMSWHDKISKSRVVTVPPPRKRKKQSGSSG